MVGGGHSGLWTALIAKERDPSADVVLIEASPSGSPARADAREGRRNLWLRTLDRAGLGFDG
ncbi:hypothetical protein ACF09L_20355 [Streptomyces sp. NPDC014779]|uniref:hypothetical protein n=1 Tax=Streptomyces sp. NPDC014779 TaxID=3364911 RepID=UPI0036F5E2BF